MMNVHELLENVIEANSQLWSRANPDFTHAGAFIALNGSSSPIGGMFEIEHDGALRDVVANIGLLFQAKKIRRYATSNMVIHKDTGEEAVMFCAADVDGTKICKVRMITRTEDSVLLGPVAEEEGGSIFCELLSMPKAPDEIIESVTEALDAHIIDQVSREFYGGQKPVLH